MPYYVCTYANPNSADFTLGTVQAKHGGLLQIIPSQSYQLAPNPPAGYVFHNWSQSDGVHVSDLTSPNATVTFDANTRGTCVGNLTVNYTTSSTTPPPPPGGVLSPTVTSTKFTYMYGESIQFTGSGFTPNGSATKCITVNGPGSTSLICAGDVTADSSGNISGSFEVGNNIPLGPQDFVVQDKTSGAFAPGLHVTITAAPIGPPPPPPPNGGPSCSPKQFNIFGTCVDKNAIYIGGGAVVLLSVAYLVIRRGRKR